MMKFFDGNKRKITGIILVCFILVFQQGIASENNTSNEYFPIDMIHEDLSFLSDLDIYTPRSSQPAFAVKDSTFTITITGRLPTTFFVYISTAYEPVVDDIWLPIEMIHSIDSIKHEITVSTPTFTPVELYNLTILVLRNGEYLRKVEPRAVQVIEEFKESFSFIHITDFHVGDPRGLFESIQETIGWKSVKRCINEINILHPDFVVISGDLTYGQLYPFEYRNEYDLCYDMIQQFDVPTFLAPGNHDGYNRILEDGLAFWERYFGPLYYSFDYGNFHFQSINSYDMSKFHRLTFLFIPLNWGGSISDEQLDWIEQDLAAHQGSNHVQFMHHNPLWETRKDSLMLKEYINRENLLSLIKSYQVDLVLAGHVHWDNVTIQNGTTFITTTTPESEISVDDGYWGYRLIEIENEEIIKYNYKEPKYPIPSYHLSVETWQDDRLAMATFKNDLEMDIIGHVSLILPAGTYGVSDGTIRQQRTKDNQTQLFIEIPIPEKSTKTVLVSSIQ